MCTAGITADYLTVQEKSRLVYFRLGVDYSNEINKNECKSF